MKFYGALDLAFAALYAWFGFVLTPGRSTAFNVALALVCVLLAGGGAGLVIGARWGRPLARVACVLAARRSPASSASCSSPRAPTCAASTVRSARAWRR